MFELAKAKKQKSGRRIEAAEESKNEIHHAKNHVKSPFFRVD
jgi:hypothetical protein